jgi:PucR C-terminal helix-turn-helix domain/GGDEF-like domain
MIADPAGPVTGADGEVSRRSCATGCTTFVEWSPYDRRMYSTGADPYRWLQDYIRTVDDSLRARVSENVAQAALTSIPELADPDLQGDLRDLARECLQSIIAMMTMQPDTWVDPGLPIAGLDFARALARRGINVVVLFKIFRTGHSYFWASIMDRAEVEIDDAALRMRVLGVLWERLSRWMDLIIDQLVDVYTEERDRWLRGALARRAEIVEAILAGDDVPVEHASAVLGHDLEQHQTGLTIRAADRDMAGSGIGVLEEIAAELAARLGARRAFTLPSGAHALWAWVSTPSPPDRSALHALASRWPRIRVGVGRSAKGIEGFRRSHREAVKAQQTAARAGTPRSLTLYEDVELVSLLAADPEGMEAFIASELGPQITTTRGSERLLETALAFLECNGNGSATAHQLGIHRNTVRNRLTRAEAFLGRPVSPPDVPLQLALALQVHTHTNQPTRRPIRVAERVRDRA